MLSNRRPMTEPEFAAFLQARENRWELFNGQPVMMAPTTQRHADIVANTLASLHRQLRGTGYRATCSSTGVRVGAGTIRCPDLVVDRGPRVDLAMYATAPALVIEILSPARDPFDMHLCVFRSIRPLIPTTCAQLFRCIRPPVTRCREAACFGYQV